MAAQTALVLNTKSYAPRGKDSGNIAKWSLVGDTTFGGATSSVTQTLREPNQNGDYKIQYKLDVPKAATESSACACVGQQIARGIADIVLTVPVGLTAVERADFCDRVQALVAHAIFSASVDNLEGAW